MSDHTRFTLSNVAIYHPGADWITKSPNGPFIDSGMDIRFEDRGRLYLSVATIREMAQIAGLFDKGPTEQKISAAYAAGYEEGVKEDLSGHLARGVDQLGFLADTLRNFVAPVQIPVEDAGDAAAAVDPVVDTTGSKPARPRRSA